MTTKDAEIAKLKATKASLQDQLQRAHDQLSHEDPDVRARLRTLLSAYFADAGARERLLDAICADTFPMLKADAQMIELRDRALAVARAELTRAGVVAPGVGVHLIAAERRRVIEQEGRTAEHDAMHGDDAMARAAACYATPAADRVYMPAAHHEFPADWPWNWSEWKPCPEDRIRELVKAGQLIAAEIDRLAS